MNREREKSIIYADPKTHEFLKTAIDDGAIDRTLEEIRHSRFRETGFRNMNIVGIYYASPAVYRDIAAIYPGFQSRQNVRRRIERTIAKIWKNCSPEVQKEFPLTEIKVRKPFGRKTRERSSRAKGGPAYSVARFLEERGTATAEEIREKFELTSTQLNSVRGVLRGWGLEVPYTNRGKQMIENRRLEKVLQKSSDDLEIQRALDKANFVFCRNQSQGENSLLRSISKTARMSNLHFHLKNSALLAEVLIEAGIPLTRKSREVKSSRQAGVVQNYYYIIARHQERALEVFKQSPNLDRFRENPIERLCGPGEGEMPSTTVLAREEYRSPGCLFKELGINLRKAGITYLDFFDKKCPVNVYRFHGGYHYLYPDEEGLKRYIKTRAIELGML